MYVTSWEKTNVNECANRYLSGRYDRMWYMQEYYLERYPGIDMRVRIYDNICYIIRRVLELRPREELLVMTLPQALEFITVDMVRDELAANGVPEEFMPPDEWLIMMIETVIPSFLQRRKGYTANVEEDESLELRIFFDGDMAMLLGEACEYSRDYKGWRIYHAIYAIPSFYYSVDNVPGRGCVCSNKNAYRAIGPDGVTVLKARNLAGIKYEISQYRLNNV